MNDPYIKATQDNQSRTIDTSDMNNAIYNKTKIVSITKSIARVAVFAGLMLASKFAFPFAPFIDITGTLLIACALVFGWRDSLLTSIVFILLALVMWTVGWWILTWIIWYPTLALSIAFLPKNNPRSPLYAAIIGSLYVSIFAILSSFLYIVTNMNVISEGQNVITAFWSFYLAGIFQTFLYMVTTIPLMFGLIYPLNKVLKRIK